MGCRVWVRAVSVQYCLYSELPKKIYKKIYKKYTKKYQQRFSSKSKNTYS